MSYLNCNVSNFFHCWVCNFLIYFTHRLFISCVQSFFPNLEPVISFSCAEQRFVIQIKSKPSIFLSWIMLFGLYLRILYPISGPKDFLWFSSEGFIVLHFISKSVIYFELILYKIWGQSFFLLCYLINLFFCLQMPNCSSLFVEDCPSYSQLLLHLCKNQVGMFLWDMSGFSFFSTEPCWCLHQHHTVLTTVAIE